MPLIDDPAFQAWLKRRHELERAMGHDSEQATACKVCGEPLDRDKVEGDECLVCLAWQYGGDSTIESAGRLLASLARAATEGSTCLRAGARCRTRPMKAPSAQSAWRDSSGTSDEGPGDPPRPVAAYTLSP